MVDDHQSVGARGFLFADLRGYTRFIERHGDAAGAELLDRYRALVRAVLAEAGGAEIRTEGDSFYIVFPTARRAVLAALTLVERAAEDAVTHAQAPVSVGIGIHAGETTETAEGYVGSAVNIAARICAQATAGEVLVSDTVRSLTRTGLAALFLPRGRRRLKGIDEPVSLFAVVRPGAAPAATGTVAPLLRHRVSIWMAGIAAAIVVLSVAALSSGLLPSSLGGSRPETLTPSISPASSTVAPTPVGTATRSPFVHLPMPAGDYATSRFLPRFTAHLQAGWAADYEAANVLNLHWVDDEAACPVKQAGLVSCLNLTFAHIVTVWGECGSKLTVVGNRSADLIEWLQAEPALSVSGVQPVRIGTATAVQLDVERSAACEGPQIALFQFENEAGLITLSTDERVRLLVGEIGGDAVAVVIAAPKVAFVDFTRESRALLDSVVWAAS